MNKILLTFLLSTVMVSTIQNASATENRIRLQKTEIVGSQELPRVVTIMSWKRTESIDLPIMHGQLSQKLLPIERNELKREIAFKKSMLEKGE